MDDVGPPALRVVNGGCAGRAPDVLLRERAAMEAAAVALTDLAASVADDDALRLTAGLLAASLLRRIRLRSGRRST